jgi:hypothetical protein
MITKSGIVFWTILLWLKACLLISGCSGTPESALPAVETPAESTTIPTVETDTGDISIPTSEPDSASGSRFVGEAKWPDYIPAEIPVLEGEIETILQGDSHVRLFYRNVSKDQLLAYLKLLESLGFTLEYRIYVQEGFPDNSEEKEKKGEYDAVNITKGAYHMNITYGADPTYDIYTSAFQREADAGIALEWPSDIPASVPQPQNCVLETFGPIGDDQFHITCRKVAENVEDAYVQLLLSAGYEQKDGTEVGDHVILTTVFENDEVVVIPHLGFSPTFFSIQIMPIPEPLQWPEALRNLVPQPARCEIDKILSNSPDKYLIYCSTPDENFLEDYLSLLGGSGFEETTKWVDNDDVVLSVTMENEHAKVRLVNTEVNVNVTIDVDIFQP